MWKTTTNKNMNIFKRQKEPTGTGVYTVRDNQLTELEKNPGNGSINSIIDSLGFPPSNVHVVHTFDSEKITCIGFKILSKQAIFVLAEKPRKPVSFSDFQRQLLLIDWDFEYSSLTVEEILEQGIDDQSISLDFLQSLLHLENEGKGLYRLNEYNLYLQFEDNLLQAFSSSSWENADSKWLKEVNPKFFENMVLEAKHFHDSEIDAMEEVNKQCKALLNIPSAMQNEHIHKHQKPNGNINFFNLLIAHYTQECEVSEFLFINKGRTEQLNEFEYGVDAFEYEFNDLGKLVGVYEK